MKSYCLKCRKDTENINPRASGTSNGKAIILSKCAKILRTEIQDLRVQVMVKQWYYQNVQYVVVKNQDLLNIEKQKDYWAI